MNVLERKDRKKCCIYKIGKRKKRNVVLKSAFDQRTSRYDTTPLTELSECAVTAGYHEKVNEQ